MISAYFDASGDKSLPHLTVGGFVSSPKYWMEFEQAWLGRLAKDDLTYFKASDFNTYNGQFSDKSWRDTARRKSLVGDLMQLILDTAFRKFACGVLYSDVATIVSDEIKKDYRVNAYVLAARACISSITRWGEKEAYYGAINYVFESGDDGSGALLDMLTRHKYPDVSFAPKLDQEHGGTIRQGVVPLQAADWLAHESFRLMRDGNLERWEIRQFHYMPGEIGWLSPRDLAEVNQRLRDAERESGIT